MTTDRELEFEYKKWAHELEARAAERAHDRADSELQRVNEAAVSTGMLAIRSVLLINGGAVVAMLAFIGGMAGQGKIAVGQELASVASSITVFAWGIVSSGVGLGGGYFVNYFTAEQYGAREMAWEHPYVRETSASRRWWWARGIAQVVAIIAGLLGLSLFVCGVFDVREAIGDLKAFVPPNGGNV